MAHYALLDDNNVVVQVFVGVEEYHNNVDWEHHYGAVNKMTCKRTSYNTCVNNHRKGGTPYRKNYASPGYVYDEERDAFIPPKPFNSFVLNEDTCDWDAPIKEPELTEEQYREYGLYVWDEDLWESDNTKGWVYKSINVDRPMKEEPVEIDPRISPPVEEDSTPSDVPSGADPDPISEFPPASRPQGVVGHSIRNHLVGNPEPIVGTPEPPSIGSPPVEESPVSKSATLGGGPAAP